MTTTHPQGPATTGPAQIRPPQRWRLLGLAALAATTLAVGIGTAGASQTPAPVDVRRQAIECWIPQPAGFTPSNPDAMPGWSAERRADYRTWLATRTRVRGWDGRYEVVTRTDRGSAPFCVEVIPGSDWWVYIDDLPAVRAFLATRVGEGIRVDADRGA
jgi:hypothetical protein